MNDLIKLFWIIIISHQVNAQSWRFVDQINAQPWHQYSDSVYSNLKKNNIEKAKYFIGLADADIKYNPAKKDTIYADYIYRKGVVLDEEETNLPLFIEASKIWEESDKKNFNKLMKIYYFIGASFFDQGKDDLSIQPFEKCFEINKKNNLKLNQQFIRATNILAYIYYNNKDFKKAEFYADEYISATKSNAIESYNFDYAKIFDYKNEKQTHEKILLEFLKNYERSNLEEPDLYFKINFELFVFYYMNGNESVYKTNAYGERALELYFNNNLKDLSSLETLLGFLELNYEKLGSEKQRSVVKNLIQKYFPDYYDNKEIYDYFYILNEYLNEKKHEEFSFYFKEYENELKKNNDILQLMKLYGLSLDLYEDGELYTKEEIVSQFEYIQRNKNKISEEHIPFLDIFQVVYYFNVEKNYNEAYTILLRNKNQEDLRLRYYFLKFQIACEDILGYYNEDSLLQFLTLGEDFYNMTDIEYEKSLLNLFDWFDNFSSSKIPSKIVSKLFSPFRKKLVYFSLYHTTKELFFYNMQNFEKRFIPLSFLHRFPNIYYDINEGCYENELLVKNLSLRNQQRIASSIQKSEDEALKQKYEQFVSNKRQLTKWNELPLDKRPATYTTVNAETEILEKELVRSSVEFADAKKALSINWKQVQEKLKANELAVDLVEFRYYNKKWTDSIVYAAFVIGKDFKAPKYIPLFEEKQLAFLLERSKKDNDASSIDRQYQERSICDLFLNPLEKELKGISTIYLAPAGLGHQIDFSALPISVSQTLGEKYKVHVLGSTAQILSYNQEYFDKNDKIDLLLYGAVNYDKSEDTTKIDYVSNDDRPDDQFQQNATRCGIAKWSYLGGTKKEVEQIEIAARNNGFSTTIVNESNATEESIKKLDGRKAPFVLHLATHGFFFADPKQELQEENLLLENKYKVLKNADDPMMRSGLLFAGANKYWTKPTENLNTDDGILTASEISNLDLSACQLVVLSACETGLGEIKGSEGVFGLQRAFKMAGVKNIIMSLWKVPDAQTAELFEIFYSECLAGKSIHESLKTAQEQMKQKYSPYYWAGFVLLE